MEITKFYAGECPRLCSDDGKEVAVVSPRDGSITLPHHGHKVFKATEVQCFDIEDYGDEVPRIVLCVSGDKIHLGPVSTRAEAEKWISHVEALSERLSERAYALH